MHDEKENGAAPAAPAQQAEGVCADCHCADGENCPAAPAVTVSPAPHPADDQWIFDLAAEHEARGNGLYGPVTFTAQGLPDFVHAVIAAHLARQAQPTDISRRLREYASNNGYSHNDYADTMRQAADEIERYYGGMLAWKKTAEKKDRDWNEARMARENDRVAAREQPTDRDSILEAAAAMCETKYAGMGGAPDDPHPDAVLYNDAIHECVTAIRALKGKSGSAAPASEREAVRIIDIGQRHQLRRDGDTGWELIDAENKRIRYLNAYEANFVNSAIKAAGKSGSEGAADAD